MKHLFSTRVRIVIVAVLLLAASTSVISGLTGVNIPGMVVQGVMTPISCLFAFILTTVLLFVFDVVSMMEELKIRHGKPRSTLISSLYSYMMPIGYVAVALVLAYLGVGLLYIFLAGVLLFAVLGIPTTVRVLRHMGEWFLELETLRPNGKLSAGM